MKNNILNKHLPVMLKEIKSFIPTDKELNVIDATFGGGGYSKLIIDRSGKSFNESWSRSSSRSTGSSWAFR